MLNEKDSDLNRLQEEIEKLLRQPAIGAKNRKKLEELENNMSVGMIALEVAAEQLLAIQNDVPLTNKNKETVSNQVMNFKKTPSYKHQGPTKGGLSSLVSTVARLDGLIMELVMRKQLTEQEKLQVIVLAYCRYSLENGQNLSNNNGVISELLTEEIRRMDKFIDNLKDNSCGKLALINEAANIINMSMLADGSTERMVKFTEKAKEDDYNNVISQELRQLKIILQDKEWPMLIKLFL